MMAKSDLIDILNIFAHARSKLVSDFVEQKPDVFSAIFKYENDCVPMKFFKERYFIEWINYHFILFNDDNNPTSPCYNLFIKTMSQMLSRYVANNESDNSELMQMLIAEKLMFMQNILSAHDDSDIDYNKLIYSYEKDKALYNRKFKELKGFQ